MRMRWALGKLGLLLFPAVRQAVRRPLPARARACYQQQSESRQLVEDSSANSHHVHASARCSCTPRRCFASCRQLHVRLIDSRTAMSDSSFPTVQQLPQSGGRGKLCDFAPAQPMPWRVFQQLHTLYSPGAAKRPSSIDRSEGAQVGADRARLSARSPPAGAAAWLIFPPGEQCGSQMQCRRRSHSRGLAVLRPRSSAAATPLLGACSLSSCACWSGVMHACSNSARAHRLLPPTARRPPCRAQALPLLDAGVQPLA